MAAWSTRAFHAFRTVFSNRDLGRLEAAFVGFSMSEWATWISIMVFAFEQGGATEAGVVAVIQLVPSALVAPVASALGDRYRRERFLVGGYAMQVVAVGATGLALLLDAPVPLVYLLAAWAAASVTLTRPGQGALLPSLARTPDELTAANAVTGVIESAAFLAGPAVAGILLGVSGPAAVFLAMAGILACSTLVAAGIRTRSAVPASVRERAALPSEAGDVRPPRARLRAAARDALGGFRALAGDRHSRLVVGVTAGQSLVIGALDVLTVVLALAVLDLGQSGAGFLIALLGGGGIAGSIAAVALVGRRRLTPGLAFGAILLGLPVVVIGLAPAVAVTVAMYLVAGAGRSLLDVAGRTLLQRIVHDVVLTRVFGVLEGLNMAALAVGSLGASGLVAALGSRGALLAAGALLPAMVALAWPRLSVVEAGTTVPVRELELLESIPLFAPLSPPTLEWLAASLVPVEAPAGRMVIREGEPADRFYVVDRGELEVSRAGRGLATLGPGDSFGEIALLRDVPRTASVRTRTDVRLLALERGRFLAAVTGTPASLEEADRVVRTRLTR